MASKTPDYISKIFSARGGPRWRRRWREAVSAAGDDENSATALTREELALVKLKEIILWESPIVSLSFLAAVNVAFWFIVYAEFKFYGLIFTALLLLSLKQLWHELFRGNRDSGSGSDHESTIDVLVRDDRLSSVDEINRFIGRSMDLFRNVCIRLKRIREKEPGSFFVAACIALFMLSVTGSKISGVTLFYTVLMTILIVPGACVRLLPPSIANSISHFVESSHTDSDASDGDFLPDETKDTLEWLRLAGDAQTSRGCDTGNDFLEQISARTNDTAESSCSKMSFYPDSDMPSVDSSLDFLEFEPTAAKTSRGKTNDSEGESDIGDINFQSKHFNGDTSDEDEFAKGLRLKGAYEDQERTEDGKSSSGPDHGGRSQANVKTTDAARRNRESSSDTDSFEVISEEDM